MRNTETRPEGDKMVPGVDPETPAAYLAAMYALLCEPPETAKRHAEKLDRILWVNDIRIRLGLICTGDMERRPAGMASAEWPELPVAAEITDIGGWRYTRYADGGESFWEAGYERY